MLEILKKVLHRHTRDSILVPRILSLLKLKILDRRAMIALRENHVFLFDKSETIKTKCSTSIGEVPRSIKNRFNSTFDLQQPFVLEFADVQLLGSKAVGMVNDTIIAETTLPPHTFFEPRFEGGISAWEIYFANQKRTDYPTIDLAFSLVNNWNKNYYHWLFDCLTRVEGFEKYIEKFQVTPKIIVNSSPTAWQKDSLKLLGYGDDQLIEWNVKKANVKNLIIPSFRRQGEWVSPSALNWLKERILQNLPFSAKEENYSRRIYISRAGASGRRVVNENEVFDYLEKFGFQSYELEKLSFSQQVSLFSNAEIVVSPHGAGLANIIFSPPGLTVLEFVTSSSSPSYFVPSMILNFNHACLECHQTYLQKIRQTRGDITVNMEDLKYLINKLL